MAKTKEPKPKKKADKPAAEKKAGDGTLEALEAKLAKAQFDQRLVMEPAEEGQACSMVWGEHKGEETPRIFVLALPPGS